MLETRELLLNSDFPAIERDRLKTLQVNMGYRCNLSCTHCHVNAGPTRAEMMDQTTVNTLIRFMDKQSVQTLDLTGGAPEMNPHFRVLVSEARDRGVEVVDRCNLVILQEPGYENMADFFVSQGVIVVASLPCYLEENVSKQRGKGVYEVSIGALKKLNSLGYGVNPELTLNLVYNPVGPYLPPPQEVLQADYKRELRKRHGIEFNELYTITNMPISRFGSVLISKGQYNDYMELLRNNYSVCNLQTVMCRSLISVDWQGYVYDCDFNQMLNLPLRLVSDNEICSDRRKIHIDELIECDLQSNAISVAEHCYACTAGQGSSCGGALEN